MNADEHQILNNEAQFTNHVISKPLRNTNLLGDCGEGGPMLLLCLLQLRSSEV